MRSPEQLLSPAIGDYGLIGDGRSAALVSRHGSIDWLCWPRFDSPAILAALLDPQRGGRWQVRPAAAARVTRKYLAETNVLETRFENAAGEVRLVDFMAVLSEEEKRTRLSAEHELVRIVECVRGELPMELSLSARPDYARRAVRPRRRGALGVRIEDGPRLYTLHSTEALEVEGSDVHARWVLREGERAVFVLTYDADGPATLVAPEPYAQEALERTVRWWRGWVGGCRYRGPHRDAVLRSVLTLKLLSYAPSGAIVAAPTASLPERLGGDLNWDYRFCWLRDAALTVRVLFDLGFEEEAESFVGWLLHSTRLTRPELRVLYDVYGKTPADEQQLGHLSGFRDSRPVRIQNGAADQLQLDSYGEVIDAVAQMARRDGPLDRETQRMLSDFGEYVCRNWERPDQGIWEPRGPPRHYTHSKLLCWVALDRCLELHQLGVLKKIPAERFEHNRALLRDEIERRAWNDALQSYTQTLEGDSVDASLLLMSWYGFHPARAQRMRSTARLIRERLEPEVGLFYRNEQSLLTPARIRARWLKACG
ncbi:MAG: glycoside hydrolase family 15 protein [Myxococcota bacterium]|nr:glycoside hydrolase family 15 protein [Myxococcota bacterium]